MIASKRDTPMAVIAMLTALLACGVALAEPWKCSDEHKACLTLCSGMANVSKRTACITNCGQRRAECLTTGCWNNGVKMYCDLLRR